jgi:DNA modification methylase
MTILIGDYREVLSNVRPDLIFTSPPYNIGSKGLRRCGDRKNGVYDPKSYSAITDYPDSLPEEEYQRQQHEFLVWCSKRLRRRGVLVYNHKNRRRNKAMISPHVWFGNTGLTLVDEIVWDRGSTHNHDTTMQWPHTERLYVFRRSQDRHWVFDNKGDDDPFTRSDVWRISRGKRGWHNCAFPVELADAVIRKYSEPGALVCDPYAGSGTTGIAAGEANRRFIGAELMDYAELKEA